MYSYKETLIQTQAGSGTWIVCPADAVARFQSYLHVIPVNILLCRFV